MQELQMSERVGLVSGGSDSRSSASPTSGANNRERRGFTTLPAALLRNILLQGSPADVALSARICIGLSRAAREDLLWYKLLERDFAKENPPSQLQLRIREALHQHSTFDIREHAEQPSRNNPLALLNRLNEVAESKEDRVFHAQHHLTPLHTSQRIAESGIPRSRSTLSVNVNPFGSSSLPTGASPSSAVGGIHSDLPSNVRSALHPRPLDQSEFHQQYVAASDSECPTPFMENGPALDEEDEEDEEDPRARNGGAFGMDMSPGLSRQQSAAAVAVRNKVCASSTSIKGIYQETVMSCFVRFDYQEHLAAAESTPNIFRMGLITASLFGVASLVLLHVFAPHPAELEGLTGGEDATLVSSGWWLLHPAFLSFVYTSSTTAILVFMLWNVIRTLVLSNVAKAAIWKPRDTFSNDFSPDAPVPRFASGSFRGMHPVVAEEDDEFQTADKKWWRSRFSNRWYQIRYQVWHPPMGKLFYLFLTGIGLFMLLHASTAALFAGYSNLLGVFFTLAYPGLVVTVIFQLGRMLFLSRFTHIFLAALLSATQLAFLVYLLHAQNPLLLSLFDRSILLAMFYLALSFTPNLILLFCILWISDEYLMMGWTPVILPPDSNFLDAAANSISNSNNNNSNHHNNNGVSSDSHSSQDSVSINIHNPSFNRQMSDNEVYAQASPVPNMSPAFHTWQSHPIRAIPAANTFGRLIFGAELEKRFIESRMSTSTRAKVLSRVAVAIMFGIFVYFCSYTYFDQLFALFLPTDTSFTTCSLLVRLFHIVSLVQFLVQSICGTLLVLVVALQNRNWNWWWVPIDTNFCTILCMCIHFLRWKIRVQEDWITAARDGAEDPTAASLSASYALQSQFNNHWAYSWNSTFALWFVMFSLSVVFSVVAMVILYRPKRVSIPIADPAYLAAAVAQHRQSRAASYADQVPPSPRLRQPTPTRATASHPLSSSPLHAPNGRRTPPRLSFLSSIQVPASPEVMNENEFQEQLVELAAANVTRARANSEVR